MDFYDYDFTYVDTNEDIKHLGYTKDYGEYGMGEVESGLIEALNDLLAQGNVQKIISIYVAPHEEEEDV